VIGGKILDLNRGRMLILGHINVFRHYMKNDNFSLEFGYVILRTNILR